MVNEEVVVFANYLRYIEIVIVKFSATKYNNMWKLPTIAGIFTLILRLSGLNSRP